LVIEERRDKFLFSVSTLWFFYFTRKTKQGFHYNLISFEFWRQRENRNAREGPSAALAGLMTILGCSSTVYPSLRSYLLGVPLVYRCFFHRAPKIQSILHGILGWAMPFLDLFYLPNLQAFSIHHVQVGAIYKFHTLIQS
jgi:hypothetical protein